MTLGNRFRWLAVAGALAAGSAGVQAQTATITGRVTTDDGGAVAGAQVVVTSQTTGNQTGGLSSEDGRYTVGRLQAGVPYKVDVRMIGYGLQSVSGVQLTAGQTMQLDFTLTQEAVALDALEVFATRAEERETPVAFSNVGKVQIQQQLGGRDLPMVLNVTPSVYSTMQGGGAGDARINVRGFSQRNTAVMVNGVPVNDMENGWVYWSDWDGLGDAATSIQLQRGMSAVNLATPSIGGTLNIITDPSAQEPSVSYKQEIGLGAVNGTNDWGLFRKNANGNVDQYANLLKETLTVNTGEHAGFALTGSAVRKSGSGVYRGFAGGDATWTDAWSYYIAGSYQINSRHRLEVYALNAPQAHGQNLYALNLGTLDRKFAENLDDYAPQAFGKFGLVAGRAGSPNVAPVNPSYTGQQYASSGPESGTNDRHDPDYINERENYFSKPQVNLNWYAYLGSGLSLTTVGYYSGGRGGGTGTYGSMDWVYDYTQRYADWNATIADNMANAANGTSARGILRNSVNNEDTWGAISKLRKDFSGGWTGEVGVDWRTANIDHFREVRDLLGGTFYTDNFLGDHSDFWASATPGGAGDDRRPQNQVGPVNQRGLGDKVDYYHSNTVDWLGAYVQGEHATREGSLYGMFGWSQNSYSYEDFFTNDGTGNPLVLNTGNMNGYQIKGGAVRNVTNEWSVFGNAGYVSKVPILDGAIDDVNGVLLDNPKNEKFLSFEAGATFRSSTRGLSFDVSFYHTTWRDRTFNLFVPNLSGTGQDGSVRLLGVDQRHLGVEMDGAWQPSQLVRFDAAASIGYWKYLNDVTGQFISDDRTTTYDYDFYIKDLKVADAPQQQFALTTSFFPLRGLTVAGIGRLYQRYYANFSPASRCIGDVVAAEGCATQPGTPAADEVMQRNQPWEVPSYAVFDLTSSYSLGNLLPVAGGADVRLFLNVYNLFNTVYVQDATDNSSFNGFDQDHDSDDAEVFLGIPRNVNMGFQVTF